MATSNIGQAGRAQVSPLAMQKEVPLAPTPMLKFVRRVIGRDQEEHGFYVDKVAYILQQWWAPDVPDYMRSGTGEWRDVPVEEE